MVFRCTTPVLELLVFPLTHPFIYLISQGAVNHPLEIDRNSLKVPMYRWVLQMSFSHESQQRAVSHPCVINRLKSFLQTFLHVFMSQAAVNYKYHHINSNSDIQERLLIKRKGYSLQSWGFFDSVGTTPEVVRRSNH